MRSNGSGSGGGRLGILLAVFDFPMLVAGLRSTIDAELDLHVVGQVPERETVLLAGHLGDLHFTTTEVPFTLALYGSAARAGVIEASAEERVRRAAH